MSDDLTFPEKGRKLYLKSDPTEIVEYTGKSIRRGKMPLVEIRYPNGSRKNVPLTSVVMVGPEDSQDPKEQIQRGIFGRAADFSRLITYEKLKGTLNEVIYSMEAANVDFYPYQFKPVLKFINSPMERLVLADEVGLGKTIESGLIWMEMQARYRSKRLLVVCPKTLAEKWQQELLDKFGVDARIVDFKGLRQEIDQLKRNGDCHQFSLIATYSSLRPEHGTHRKLDIPENDEGTASKARLLRELKFWDEPDYMPFDLLVFDEAHCMRNAETSTYLVGEALSKAARGLLCVSATPVNNKSTDLQSLLSFIDEDFFDNKAAIHREESFENLMRLNKPAVRIENLLALPNPDMQEIEGCIREMNGNQFIVGSKLFEFFKEKFDVFKNGSGDKFDILSDLQEIIGNLNILGAYVNRTRRVQVKERRAKRDVQIVTVQLSEKEQMFYDSIERVVKNKCRSICGQGMENRIFQVMNYQLRAASCIPAFARSLLVSARMHAGSGFKASFSDMVADAVADGTDVTVVNERADDNIFGNISMQESDIRNFTEDDSKFALLMNILRRVGKEKIVIFSFFRGTIEYLQRRLKSIGYALSVVHGGIPAKDRWKIIEQFTEGDNQVLLASEVGGEGIDLQCAHVLVNYDMPWNPMRVEQRIGRIDRVGQTADKLTIFNFNIAGTIEQRIYEKLHDKLGIFSSTLGDFEEMIGTEIRKLSVDLITSDLSVEEENERIGQTRMAFENNLRDMQRLEEQCEGLAGLSDYVQKKIEEYHGRGRYIRPQELSAYVSDFFGRKFQGTQIDYDTPAAGCMRLSLSEDARESLNQFMGNDKSPMARDLRREFLDLVFDRGLLRKLSLKERRNAVFITHFSPLVRWIISYQDRSEAGTCRTAAIRARIPGFPAGRYVFCVQRWIMKDISSLEKLAFAIKRTGDDTWYSLSSGERFFQGVFKTGSDWLYRGDDAGVGNELDAVEKNLEIMFDDAYEKFMLENENTRNFKKNRITEQYERKIASIERTITSLREKEKGEGVIRMTKARLEKTRIALRTALEKLEHSAENIKVENGSIAMGIVLNEPEEV